MTASPVVALHNHTEYSSFDGLQRLKTMWEQVVADPAWEQHGIQPACAITDHGTLGGAWKFAKAAREVGGKPILGNELYLAVEPGKLFGSRTERGFITDDSEGVDADDKGETKGKTRRYNHLTVHALNETGWKNLLRISNEAHDHDWYKPRTDMDFIAEHHEGLMVGTGCLGGPVASHLMRGDYDKALAAASHMRDIFGPDRMFVEVMSHGIEKEDREVLPKLARIAKELDLRLVATNDAHFTFEHESKAHDHWLAIGVNKRIDDPDRFRFNGEGYWLKSAEQMHATMARFASQFDGQDPVANTLWVAEQVEDNVLAESRLRLPKFPLDPDLLGRFMHERGEHRARFGSDTEFYLHEMVRRGAIERYGSPLPETVRERLAYEMGIIGNAGLWDYFLIVADMISWARSQGIMAGPGRGSAAGCAVSYCLQIVDVDPIANGLLMERFLDPYRAGMPDIDSDFDQGGRDRVIGYLMEKYGEDHVARIGTFGTMGVKKAVRDLARLQGNSEIGADLAGRVPSMGGKPLSFDQLLERNTKALASDDPKTVEKARVIWSEGEGFRALLEDPAKAHLYSDVVDLSRPFGGVITREGIHACGVLVSAEPLDTLVPTRRDQKSKMKTRVTTWEAHDVEELGLLKLDDLGLRTLDIVSTALRMIEETTGEVIDTRYGVLSMDGESDPRARAAWDVISSGKTQGIFQLEGGGMAKLCEAVQPSSLEDLSAVVALYRPGPLGAGMHTRYADRKHGREAISYDYLTRDPEEQEVLASVLDATNAVVCIAKGERVYSATRGQMVPIEQIEVGELVQGVNESGKHTLAPITAAWMTAQDAAVIRVRLEDGRSIRLTANHLIYTDRGWVEAGSLDVGSLVATPESLLSDAHVTGKTRWLPVVSVEPDGEADVYDLTVEGIHSFVAEGVVVHNCYQEQIMELAGLVAGFGPGKKNKLRKAFSKKIRSEMEALEADFLAGAVVDTEDNFEPGTDTSASIVFRRETAAELWRTFDASAEYLFNKCITGDALLFTGRGVGPKAETWTVEDLYRRLHGDDSVPVGTCRYCGERDTTPRTDRCKRCMSWHTKFRDSRGFSVLALDSADGRIRPQRVADVHANGVKPVYEVMTADGRSVKVTGNHRLMTPAGWAEAQHLSVGDELVVHGGYQSQEWEPEKIRTTVGERQGFPGRAGLPGKSNNGFIDGGFMDLSDWTKRTIGTAACTVCNVTKAQARLERAHLNGDRTDNSDANLAWMCVSHHKEHDYRVNGRRRRWEKGHTATTSQIVSITPAGEQMTYDVEMADGTDHNFVANGIVSHNSHSAGYGYLAYVTAYLKANWPSHYGAALLSVTKDDEKRLATLSYLRGENLEVLAPDVNLGGVKTSVDAQTSAIRLGMGEVKGVGANSAAIVEEREANGPFASLFDLMDRVKITTAKPSNEEVLSETSSHERICHACLRLVGINAAITAESDEKKQEALIEQRELFGACSCDAPRTSPEEDDEPRVETLPGGITSTVSVKTSGGKFKKVYKLHRKDVKPELDDTGNPIMVHANLSTGLVEALIEAGACDTFGQSRRGMVSVVRALRDIPDYPTPDIEWSIIERAKRERARLGMVASGSVLSQVGGPSIKAWAKSAEVDGLRASELVQLHLLDEADYALTIGVVASWEERSYSGGTMARFVLEGTHGSLPGVAWDSAVSSLKNKLGTRSIEPGDVLAVSGRVKTSERRRAMPAGDAALDTETGEELDETQVVIETETVREISVQTAWLADFTDGLREDMPAMPVLYSPPSMSSRRAPAAQPTLDLDGDGDDSDDPDPGPGPDVPDGPDDMPPVPDGHDVPHDFEPDDWDIDAVNDHPRDGAFPDAEYDSGLGIEPDDEVERPATQPDDDGIEDGSVFDVEPPKPDKKATGADQLRRSAVAVPVKTNVYMLEANQAANHRSKSWRHFERTFPGILTRVQIQEVGKYFAGTMANRSYGAESPHERRVRHEYPLRFDVADGLQLVFQAYDVQEYGDNGWTPEIATDGCADLLKVIGSES